MAALASAVVCLRKPDAISRASLCLTEVASPSASDISVSVRE
jgi:hypothetical protein